MPDESEITSQLISTPDYPWVCISDINSSNRYANKVVILNRTTGEVVVRHIDLSGLEIKNYERS